MPATEEDATESRVAMERNVFKRSRKGKNSHKRYASGRRAAHSVSYTSSEKHKRRRMAAVRKQSIFGKKASSAQAKRVDAAFDHVPRSSRLSTKPERDRRTRSGDSNG